MNRKARTAFLALIPVFLALWVWLSPLAFTPVPWPDDSAFYFVGKHLFSWPPRWVMISQAPFEPTYRIFNFNTMPLYPILVGMGRWVGIDGSFALKFWPLGFWAASGALLGVSLFRAGLPFALSLLFTLGYALNPELRWSSVLIRPESLLALCGLGIVLGITLGFPERLKPKRLWDPIAALLAVAAYAHFNAVHLLFPVLLVFATQPGRLIAIGLRTLLYLTPWLLTVLWHPRLFFHQMTTQWSRLAVPNGWLDSLQGAIDSLFQGMGNPDPWPGSLYWTGPVLWFLILSALIFGLALPVLRFKKGHSSENLNLTPAAGWVLGSLWLWHSKPEVWFIHFIHASIWCFAGIATLRVWRGNPKNRKRGKPARAALAVLVSCTAFATGVFAYVDFTQAITLGQNPSWRWSTYKELIDCIDSRLSLLENQLGNPKPFRVWDPTFPDVTIELSRRHPDWEFSRTNDFWSRSELAIRHGQEVEAVVVPETLGSAERVLSSPAAEHPEIQSLWMNWKPYFLNRLYLQPGWKPDRYICQRGRWQAFLFLKSSK